MLVDNIGYVRISSFNKRTPEELDEKLSELEQQGLAGLIIDLRYNPGGLLDAAIDIASMFASSGPVLFVEGRNGPRQELPVNQKHVIKEYPVICLVNNMSASASEILSGFFKDRQLGLVIGQQTSMVVEHFL